jgi:hypothetical protein
MPATYEPIATATVASTGGTITFSSIPSTYTDLILISSARRGIDGSGGDAVKAQVNGDSGSNYSWNGISYNAGGTGASRANNQSIFIAGSCEDGVYSTSICHFMNYSNTTTFKTMLTRTSSTGTQGVGTTVNLWRSTTAINSIFLNAASGFYAGSVFTLYGIKAA